MENMSHCFSIFNWLEKTPHANKLTAQMFSEEQLLWRQKKSPWLTSNDKPEEPEDATMQARVRDEAAMEKIYHQIRLHVET